MKSDEPTCEFYGFESRQEGKPVQEWYNKLGPDAQLEIISLASTLRTRPSGLWIRPDFDPLAGEGGISELRPRDIRTEEGNKIYRIYGFLGYPEKRSYTFLHGTDKEVSNDIEGKGIAKARLHQLLFQDGQVHKFDFEGESVEEAEGQ